MNRIETEAIIEVYQQTQSIWKTGKKLGIAGQTVHKRLVAANYMLSGNSQWTAEESNELLSLVENGLTAAQIADRLGRSFAGVTCKLSELGVKVRKNGSLPKIPRGQGYDKAAMKRHMKALEADPKIKITRYARQNSLAVEPLVQALQRYFPERMKAYVELHHADIPSKCCPYCERSFVPSNGKQVYCTRVCASDARKDRDYFGGRRREAIGFSDSTCQICFKQEPRLQVHHVIGKVNDQDNKYMVALCKGCHQLVGRLAWSKRIVNDSEAWERLIQFSWLEANGSAIKPSDEIEVSTSVELQVDHYQQNDHFHV